MRDCNIDDKKLSYSKTEKALYVWKRKHDMSMDVEASIEVQNHESNDSGSRDLHVWYVFLTNFGFPYF